MRVMEPDNTVESIRDDLDNYGNHLTVVIEDLSGRLREIGDITTRTIRGEVFVVIPTGGYFEPEE